MISAVLDTNTLASGTVNSFTPPGQIINQWREGKFKLITSQYIIDELYRTLQKPYFQKHLSLSQIEAFIDLLQNEATLTQITVNLQGVATHTEDDYIIATAVSAKSDYLVTGDGPLRKKLGSLFRRVNIVTPSEFFKILQQ
ncbi:MAG TPA: putative toxin-antitoxin system toxin component, PIN family [Patescibacteria group bacterium]|nr:putative toxin-antitoxin system toxin component, PIN family [Patescibacteria group bacterium]